MSSSTESIANLVAAAAKELQEDADANVGPVSRRRLLLALGRGDSAEGHARRTQLAVRTARHVLPVWAAVRPNDKLPSRLVDAAEAVVDGSLPRNEARSLAEEAEEQLEELGGSLPDSFDETCAFHAAQAAASALAVSIEDEPLEPLDASSTDSDLDPYEADTALWAAAAYAGPLWNQASDRAKRDEFWKWWLAELQRARA